MHPLIATAVTVAALVPVAVSAVTGTVIPFAVDLITKRHAPAPLKAGTAAVLAALDGALSTVALTPGERWQDYAVSVAMAWLMALTVHSTGASRPVQNATAGFGLGDVGIDSLLMWRLMRLACRFGLHNRSCRGREDHLRSRIGERPAAAHPGEIIGGPLPPRGDETPLDPPDELVIGVTVDPAQARRIEREQRRASRG